MIVEFRRGRGHGAPGGGDGPLRRVGGVLGADERGDRGPPEEEKIVKVKLQVNRAYSFLQ